MMENTAENRVKYTGAAFAKHAAWWKSLLNPFGKGFRLASVGNLGPGKSGEFSQVTGEVSIPESVLSRTSGRDGGILVYTIGALALVLHRYTSHPEIIVHTPRFGSSGAHGIASSVPLCIPVVGSVDFSTYLRTLKNAIKSAYQFQDYPVGLAQAPHSPEPFASNILLSYQGLHAEIAQEKYGMAIAFHREGTVLRTTVSYDPAAFSAYFVRQVLAHLGVALKALPDVAQKLRDFSLWTPEEEAVRIQKLGPKARFEAGTSTLQSVFQAQVDASPDAIAVRGEGEELTYAQLNQQANRLAHLLRNRFDTRPNDRIGLLMGRTTGIPVAVFGILKAGGAYVPISPAYPEARIQYMLQDAHVAVAIVDSPELAETCEKYGVPTVRLAESNSLSAEEPENHSTATDLAYIIYTSGSTGQPKGVGIRHENVLSLICHTPSPFEFLASDTWTLFHSICFDFSVWEMFGALLSGSRLVVVSEAIQGDLLAFANLLMEERVTVLNTVPGVFTHLNRVMDGLPSQNLQLRYVIFGGEALKQSTLQAFHARWPDVALVNMYGITETTVHVTFKKLERTDLEQKISNIGQPLDTMGVYILDPEMRLLPDGVPGEIFVSGAGVSSGYLQNEALTRKAFLADQRFPDFHLYRSGDLGLRLPSGDFAHLGRKDRQVKRNGFRIEKGEIEFALQQLAGIQEAVVVAVPLPGDGLQLIAFWLGPEPLSSSMIKEACSSSIPAYMLPDEFVQVDEFPRTAVGKVDEQALLKVFGTRFAHNSSDVLPVSETERKLLEISREVLGLPELRILDHFFQKGGHSLSATVLTARIRKNFGISFSIDQVFLKPVLRDLAAEISSVGHAGTQPIIPVPEAAHYPLSHAQKRIWIMHQVDGGLRYNISHAFEMQGDLKLSAMNLALQALVERHESLRTVFRMVDGEIRQHILSPEILGFELGIQDLQGRENLEELVREEVKSETLRPFDLAKGPLVRAKILQCAPQRNVLLFSIYHIITDGWSMQILRGELVALYNAFSAGLPQALGELPLQYRDYAVWHNAQMATPEMDEHRDYFLTQFAGQLPVLNFPKDFPDPEAPTPNSESIVIRLDKKLTDGIQAMSLENDATVFMTMLAFFKAILYRYTGQEDLIVGSPFNGREYGDLQEVVGVFINTVPLRTRLEGRSSFLALLQEVRQTCMDAFTHQSYPFDRLVGGLELDRNEGNSRMFDVLFVSEDSGLGMEGGVGQFSEALSGLKIRMLEKSLITYNKFDLTLYFSQISPELELRLAYDKDLFLPATMQAFMGHFEALVRGALAKPQCPVLDLEILQSIEYEQLVGDFNRTQTSFSDTLGMHQLFERQVIRQGNRVAVKWKEETISYAKLNAEANRFAHALIHSGVQAGDPVGLICHRNFGMLIGLLGILKAGGWYVPVDPEYPEARKTYVLENSGVRRLALGQGVDLEAGLRQTFQVVPVSGETFPATDPEIAVDPDRLAYTIYTSGSTGRPKGVMVCHKSAVNLIEWVNNRFEVHEKDRLLFITSYCFDLSVYDIFGMLAAGGTIVMAQEEEVRDPAALVQLVQNERITFWDSVPSSLNMLVTYLEDQTTGFDGQDLRLAFMSGDWIPVALPERARRFFPNLKPISLGGATEGTVWSNYFPIGQVEKAWRSIPYGKPVANNYFYILDSALRPVPRGVVGDLFIGGIGVAEGYINEPEKTGAAFLPDPFHQDLGGRMYKTGDLGRMLPNGQMEFLGRKDFQMKIRGFRVEAGEVEFALLQMPEIRMAVVTMQENANSGNFLVAYLVADHGLETVTIKHFLASQVPDYMIPGSIVFLSELPLNRNGKVDRTALPKVGQASQEFQAPQSQTERALAEIWKEVLGVESVGLQDNFFEIGGHSLKATQVISRVFKGLNAKISLRDIFTEPTLAELAQRIESSQAAKVDEIPKAPLAETYPLSHAQKRLWVIDQMESQMVAYNMNRSWWLKGALDRSAFERTLEMIVARHEILRSVFKVVDGTPRQLVQSTDSARFKLEFTDLRFATDGLVSAEALLTNAAKMAFDLERGPMIRAHLIQLEADLHVLGLSVHHIACDGWSMSIIVEEFSAIYRAFLHDDPLSLPEPPIQYKDFASWQAQQDLTRSENYWLDHLSGSNELLRLPYDFPETERKTFVGGSEWLRLEPEMVTVMANLAVERKSSLSNVFLTMFIMLLRDFCQEDEITVGIAVANRNIAVLEKLIGFFVNSLLIRVKLPKDAPFASCLDQVTETAIAAYEHQDYPFDLLVDRLNPERVTNKQALMNVMYAYQNMNDLELDIDREKSLNQVRERREAAGGLVVETLLTESNRSYFDLTHRVLETRDGHWLQLEFNSDLFRTTTIRKLLHQYAEKMRKVVHHSVGENH